MAHRWLIHSRDRTLGPWTPVQVRDELRAGRIDPFDMACKEGSSVKRPLVEVDEIFQSSRVQMGELVTDPEEIPERESFSTRQQTAEPELKMANSSSGQTLDRPRPSQFQALAAATRLNPPPRSEPRKPKQYFVTDSTGRSYGPLSSGEVMKLWHNGRVDGRAIVERGSSSRRINIQRFVEFYQNAAPSGMAFLQTKPAQRIQARYITVVQDSAFRPIVWLCILLAAGALIFLGMTVRDRLPPKLNRFLPKTKPAAKVERFDLRSIETIAAQAPTPSAILIKPAPVAIQPLEIKPIKPRKVIEKAPKQKKKPNYQSKPRYIKPPTSVRPSAQAPMIGVNMNAPPVAVIKPAVGSPPKSPLKNPFVDGATITLTGYRFSAGALAQCSGKCKLPMSGSLGPVTAVFFKEALGQAFQGKAGSVSVTGILRKQESGGWQIIVSNAR